MGIVELGLFLGQQTHQHLPAGFIDFPCQQPLVVLDIEAGDTAVQGARSIAKIEYVLAWFCDRPKRVIAVSGLSRMKRVPVGPTRRKSPAGGDFAVWLRHD